MDKPESAERPREKRRWANPVRRARMAAERGQPMLRLMMRFPSGMIARVDDERKRYPAPPSRGAD
jgi:hypothetical protein